MHGATAANRPTQIRHTFVYTYMLYLHKYKYTHGMQATLLNFTKDYNNINNYQPTLGSLMCLYQKHWK